MKIPGYKLRRLIARGGTSSVYVAVQESLGRKVAVKVLQRLDSPTESTRFMHEGRVIASLNHRNIITIHDIGTVNDRMFIAMEYLEGGSLGERIKAGLKPSRILSLLEKIAVCLHVLHRRGIVHRDVKPSNILFHADGTLKLADFGIAKQLNNDQELTVDGNAIGSPYYLSPEQAEGRELDGRSDIYSLGIMFYEMLTGERPYVRKSPLETIIAHLTEPLPVLPEQFASFQPLLDSMIAKDPQDRIGSAKELARQVRALRLASLGRIDSRSEGPVLEQTGETRLRLSGLALSCWASVRRRAVPLSVTAVLMPTAAYLFWPSAGVSPGGQVAGPALVGAQAQAAPVATSRQVPAALLVAGASPAPSSVIQSSVSLTEAAVPVQTAVVTGIDPAHQTGVPVSIAPSSVSLTGALVPGTVPLSGGQTVPSTAQVAAAASPALSQADHPRPAGSRVGDQQVAAWLAAARQALANYRLTRPRNASAEHFYRLVLRAQPGNAAALKGLRQIADKYALLARARIERGDLSVARLYLARGRSVQADSASVTQVQGLLAAAQKRQAKSRTAAKPQPTAQAQHDQANVPPKGSALDDLVGKQGSGNMFKDAGKIWHAIFN